MMTIYQDEKKSVNNRLLIIILISFLFWGIAFLSGAQLNSWDGLTHIFFSKGYADNWWSVWDDRWYGGFNKASYPPLAHQLVALLIIITGKIELSYSIILWLFLTIFPLAVYRFSRVFINADGSLIAAFLSIFLPSIRVMTFVFGQFAGFASLTFLLLSISSYSIFMRQRSLLAGCVSVGWLGCVVASHTNTFFFLAPLLFVVTGLYLFNVLKISLKQKLVSNLIIISLYLLISAIIILPFWLWFLDYRMQTPIMHPSRWNLLSLVGTGIFRLYFLDMYDYLLLAYLVLAIGLFRDRSYLLLFFCFSIYFLLGLGGSTDLPNIVFGKDWEWLTYERFSVWASVISLPMIGYGLQSLQVPSLRFLLKVFVLISVLNAFIWLFNPSINQMTRQRMDLSSVYEVFNSNTQCKNRFLTLGFDYQLPEFSIYTNARTLDGLWHTARTDDFLRQSGMGSLDTALYWGNGENLLREFLARKDLVPARCIFLNETNLLNAMKYRTILIETGWRQEKIDGSLISYWVRSYEILAQENSEPKDGSLNLQILLWGILPIFNLCLTIFAEVVRCKVASCE
ncbi:MAG: hypothetical protein IH588_03600 [Anaerolineales bacterium]|nr:hypothetical protein [Anaerolineales bacterium]